MANNNLNDYRTRDGKFAKYTSFGCYPLFALLADGETMCIDCCNGANGSDANDTPETEKQWRIEAIDINWEDPDMYCAHCSQRIESAYAEEQANG